MPCPRYLKIPDVVLPSCFAISACCREGPGNGHSSLALGQLAYLSLPKTHSEAGPEHLNGLLDLGLFSASAHAGGPRRWNTLTQKPRKAASGSRGGSVIQSRHSCSSACTSQPGAAARAFS